MASTQRGVSLRTHPPPGQDQTDGAAHGTKHLADRLTRPVETYHIGFIIPLRLPKPVTPINSNITTYLSATIARVRQEDGIAVKPRNPISIMSIHRLLCPFAVVFQFQPVVIGGQPISASLQHRGPLHAQSEVDKLRVGHVGRLHERDTVNGVQGHLVAVLPNQNGVTHLRAHRKGTQGEHDDDNCLFHNFAQFF